MSLKKCPKCNKEVGPRTKVCPACSHDFAQTSPPFSSVSKNKSSKKPKPDDLTIGDGLWVHDRPKGMPKIQYPSQPCKNMSTEDVKEQVEYHGLGFCLQCYLYPNQIKDKELAKLWKNAQEQLGLIVRYLYD